MSEMYKNVGLMKGAGRFPWIPRRVLQGGGRSRRPQAVGQALPVRMRGMSPLVHRAGDGRSGPFRSGIRVRYERAGQGFVGRRGSGFELATRLTASPAGAAV